MNTDNPIKALEQISRENLLVKASPEYRMGRRILELKKYFPFHLLKYAIMITKRKKMKAKDDLLSKKTPTDDYYASPEPATDKKGIVYTCITSGYDDPCEPVLTSSCLDYKLYTEKTCVQEDSVWQVCPIDAQFSASEGNLANRYYKFNAHKLFSADYDYAVYIDGCVKIISDVTGLYRTAHEAPTGIAIHRHYLRDCAYKEAQWCELHQKGNVEKLREQVQRFREEGFPEDFGMCECPVIVIDLKSKNAERIMNEWWREFTEVSPLAGRDQISFPYIIWKLGYTMDDVGNLGSSVYNNPKFLKITSHNS